MELAEALHTIDLLRGHIEALEVQLTGRDATIQQLTNELILLRYECERHERARFGDSSERVTTQELALPGVDLSVRNDNARVCRCSSMLIGHAPVEVVRSETD